MTIDASIISGLKQPQFETPTNALMNLLQVQTAQQQSQLGQAKLDEHNRGVARQNRLYDAMQRLGPGATSDQRIGALQGLGEFDLADKVLTGDATRTKTGADAKRAEAEARKIDYENAAHQFEIAGQLASAWAQNPSVTQQQIRSGLAAAASSKIISPEIYQAKLTELDAVPGDSKSLNQWATGTLQQVMKSKDSMGFIKPDANTVANNAQSAANNAATNATSRANNAATVAASRDNASATRDVAKATRDAATIQRDQNTEMKLADDYRAQSKDFKAVSDAYQQINATLDKATTSPAATLAGATKFMKLLDPGSVVRESELGMALAATGAIDRMSNYVNTMKYGKVLTQNQVADFRNITKQIYGAAQTQQQKIDSNYRTQAETYKLRPEVIIQDLGQNTPQPVDSGDIHARADAILKGK